MSGYRREFVMHVESGTRAQVRRRVSRIVDRWVDAGGPLFPPQARQAIDCLHRLWEACPTLGKLVSSYEPRTPGGSTAYEDRCDTSALDELATIKSWFPADQWRVFEAVVRDGDAAGKAGADLADTPSAAIASTKALVGSMACTIAARKGWH